MTGLNLLRNGLRRLNLGLLSIAKYLSLTLVAVMTLVILLQVVCRYVFNDALAWTEEAGRYMMVWMTFIALPIVCYKGQHAALDFFSHLLWRRTRYLLEIVLYVLIMVVLFFALEKSWLFASKGARIFATSLPITKYWVYLSMPIGFGLSMLVYVELILDAITGLLPERRQAQLQAQPGQALWKQL
ncbi:TRAP transporter small permease [Pokkaliibacter sp. MBI-7]|uniref:TRAP transporter small permease n=1 Tax=Pokkaliibacter sp. MBI-7 TaxID=3040600 RepID=UPI00244B5BE4|nr:TRAP transporter small permease [Pokkaliibacter sp. MBI-7]MDH2433820.1 TRAP transporter small permease [Pokkaliibacter sp. MBI-7]